MRLLFAQFLTFNDVVKIEVIVGTASIFIISLRAEPMPTLILSVVHIKVSVWDVLDFMAHIAGLITLFNKVTYNS